MSSSASARNNKEPRQLKELRSLMPWTWDSNRDKHPPGEERVMERGEGGEWVPCARAGALWRGDGGGRRMRQRAGDAFCRVAGPPQRGPPSPPSP